MSLNDVCPDSQRLECLLIGRLDESEARSVEDHVEGCAGCAHRLADLAKSELRPVGPESNDWDQRNVGATLVSALYRELPSGVRPPQTPRARVPVIDGHAIHAEIGRGGMGTVYRGTQLDFSRPVAIKVLDAQSDGGGSQFVTRFQREAEVTAQLDHPSVVPVFTNGRTDDDRGYYTMRLVRGRGMKDVIQASEDAESWNRSRLLTVLVKICQAMAYAHERGVVHRDLKPGNVMVGDHGEVYVMDWGLARVLGRQDLRDIRIRAETKNAACSGADADESTARPVSPEHPEFVHEESLQTVDGAVLGTPAYMPPEQARGCVEEVDQLADVYSLGAILYHLLTGHAPYATPERPGSAHQLLRAVIAGPPEPVASLSRNAPAELHAICEKAMARDRRQRYCGALEMAKDLQAFLDQRVVRAYRTGAFVEACKWIERNRAVAGLSFLAVVLIIAGAGVAACVQNRANRRLKAANAQIERSADQVRLRAYVAEMNLASEAVRTPAGIARAAELVSHWATVPVSPGGQAALDPRGWEWFYLQSLTHRDLKSIQVGDDGQSLAWSPNGQYLALGCGFSDSKLHLLESPRPIDVGVLSAAATDSAPLFTRRQLPGGHVDTCGWSPDGRWLVTGGKDGLVRIRRAEDGTETLRVSLQTAVIDAQWGPEGRRIAAADTGGRLRVHDATSGELLSQARLSPTLKDLAWSRDGREIAVATFDGVVIVDADSGQTVRILKPDHARSVAWSADVLVSGGSGGEVSFWNVDTGELRHRAVDRFVDVETLSFSPDGHQLASGDDSGVIHVYDSDSGERQFSLAGHTDSVRSLCWSPDGRLIVSTGKDETIRFWRSTPERRSLSSIGKKVDSVAWSPDGTLVAATNRSGGAVISDSRTGSVRQHIRVPAELVAWSPDGQRIAIAPHNAQLGGISVWHVESGQEVGRLSNGGHRIEAIAWSPGPHIAMTTRHGFTVWDGPTLEELFSTEGTKQKGVAASPDGRLIATTTEDFLELWRVDTWQPTAHPIEDHTHGSALCWNADGSQIAVVTETGIGIVDTASGRRVTTLYGHTGDIQCVAWHPDGRRLASCSVDRTIRIWSPATGAELLSLHHHTDDVNTIAWSPNGWRLISGSDDFRVLIHNARPFR